MSASLLFAVLQSAIWMVTPDAPTVGDTVRLVRRMPAPPEVQARLQSLRRDHAIEPLRDPFTTYSEGTLTIHYMVALFQPGDLALPMPAAELLYADGRVESLAGDTARVTVRSVLPVGDTAPPPMPSLDPLARRPGTLSPLIILVVVVMSGTVTWGVIRRRARARPGWGDAEPADDEPPLDLWAVAGEARAVTAIASDRLRSHIATAVPDAGRPLDLEECLAVLALHRPGWPLRELRETLLALERARFAPAVSTEVMELVDRAAALESQLVGERREEVS